MKQNKNINCEHIQMTSPGERLLAHQEIFTIEDDKESSLLSGSIGYATCNWKAWKSKVLGILLVLISAILSAGLVFSIQQMQHVDAMMTISISSSIIFLTLLPVTLCKRLHVKNEVMWITMVYAFVGAFGIIFYVIALRILPFKDNWTILHLSAAMAMIFSKFVLNEVCGFYRVGVVIPLLGGIALILKPSFIFVPAQDESYTAIGYILAAFASLCQALLVILAKKVIEGEGHWLIPPYAMTCTALCLGIIGILTLSEKTLPETDHDWVILILTGPMAFLSESCFVLSLKYLSPVSAIVFRTLQIPLYIFADKIKLGSSADVYEILGAVLVIISTVAITKQNDTNQRFSCCMISCRRKKDQEVEL